MRQVKVKTAGSLRRTVSVMMRIDKDKAFTLVEVLVTLAVISILVSSIIGLARYVRVRASQQLTRSAMEVINLALQQYYEQTGSFPPPISSASELSTALSSVVTTTVTVSQGTHPVSTGDEGQRWWSSESLFYFLERVPQSKAVLSGLSGQMLSNKDEDGLNLQVKITAGGTATIYDWVRFVDAWGTEIDYSYDTGESVGYPFPVLHSAGSDKTFISLTEIGDDILNQ